MKLRALDLSMGWAGPLVTQLLAEMPSVEVIKVEDTHNYDWWRGSHAMAPPEMQPIERSPTFNTVNRGELNVWLSPVCSRAVMVAVMSLAPRILVKILVKTEAMPMPRLAVFWLPTSPV